MWRNSTFPSSHGQNFHCEFECWYASNWIFVCPKDFQWKPIRKVASKRDYVPRMRVDVSVEVVMNRRKRVTKHQQRQRQQQEYPLELWLNLSTSLKLMNYLHTLKTIAQLLNMMVQNNLIVKSACTNVINEFWITFKNWTENFVKIENCQLFE